MNLQQIDYSRVFMDKTICFERFKRGKMWSKF